MDANEHLEISGQVREPYHLLALDVSRLAAFSRFLSFRVSRRCVDDDDGVAFEVPSCAAFSLSSSASARSAHQRAAWSAMTPVSETLHTRFAVAKLSTSDFRMLGGCRSGIVIGTEENVPSNAA